jgi:hypothetical protein
MRIIAIQAVIGLLLTVGGCASASADEPDPRAVTAPVRTASPNTASRVMRTEAAREALRARLRTSLARKQAVMTVEQRADGVRVARHGGGFQHATLVVRDADGKRSQSCTDDLAAAETALMGENP